MKVPERSIKTAPADLAISTGTRVPAKYQDYCRNAAPDRSGSSTPLDLCPALALFQVFGWGPHW